MLYFTVNWYNITAKTVIIALTALSLAGCNNSNREPGTADSIKATVNDNLKVSQPVITNNTNSLKTETILLKKIEEGAYPLAAIDGELKDGSKISFNFNQEDEAYKGPGLRDIVKQTGKHITLTFLTTIENSAMHVVMNNTDILNGKVFKQDNKDEKASGILMTAAITTVDLPDTFQIKKEDGALVSFLFFITDGMVKANGKNVDVYYRKDEINTGKKIELVKE